LAALAQARGAVLWLDGGHNPHAGRALAEAAGLLIARDPRPLVLVAGMFARKDAVGFFRPFAELGPLVVATTFDSPNAATPDEIAEAARRGRLQAQTAPNVEAAVRAALERPGAAPHVLVCGGLHFAGEVLAMSPETWPR
jgi:dihydrofolate synthase / folylpolyglutamate synthase